MNNIAAKITSHHADPNGTIVYSLEATQYPNTRPKITNLRYSQLLAFHQELEILVAKLKMEITLPDFPTKKLVGSTNKSEESISNRKKQLNQYIEALLSIQQLHCLELFKRYFVPTHQIEKQHQHPNQEINIHFSIDRYAIVDDVVIYSVRLRDLDSREEWAFKSRYSQLRNVHTALQANIRYLPQFPRKKIFGITNESPEQIEKRRSELQKYFNEVFNKSEVKQSEAFTYFIQQSKRQAQQGQHAKGQSP